MKKKTGNVKKIGDISVLWMWTVSYLLILLIPLIAVFVNYRLGMNGLKKEIIRINEITLENISNSMNKFLDTEQEYFRYIYNNEYYMSLRYYESEGTRFRSNVVQLQNDIVQYRNSCSFEMDCAIYKGDIDYLISTETAYNCRMYYEGLKLLHTDLEEYEVWSGLLWGEQKNGFFICDNVLNGTMDKTLFYSWSSNNSYMGGSKIIISIPLIEIAALTNSLAEGQVFVLSLNENSEIAFGRGEIINIPEWYDNEDASIVSKDSEIGGIKYLMGVSNEYIDNELAGIRRSFKICIVLTVLFGIVGVGILLKVNYRPLAETIQKVKGVDASRNENEFREIVRIHQYVKKENVSYQELIERQKLQLTNSKLLGLLKGRISISQLRDNEPRFRSMFDGAIGVVGFCVPMKDDGKLEYDEQVFFVIENIFSELMENRKSFCIEDGKFVFCLVDLEKEKDGRRQTVIAEAAEYICNFFAEKWDNSLEGVVYGVENRIENIKFLYQKIVDAFDSQKMLGSIDVINVHDLENTDYKSELIACVQMELRDGLTDGTIEDVLHAVDRLFSKRSGLAFAFIKMYVIESFGIISEIFREFEVEDKCKSELLHYMELLVKTQNEKEMMDIYRQLMWYAYGNITQQREQESGGVTEKVKSYIVEHYKDADLNINIIAEKLQRNPRYISRVFKAETDEGILDFINRIRIDKAKILFELGGCTVEEVMKQTGYTNISTFRRIFVKMTGKTPGNYTK